MHLGGLVSSMHQGAAIWPGGAAIAHAHTGLLVGPRALAAHDVPIIAQEGEGILSRRVGMPALAEWALSAMNQGRLPSSTRAGDQDSGTSVPISIQLDGEVLWEGLVRVGARHGWTR
jgi:hypothetical protein